MDILKGITYNLRGLGFSLKTPSLLFWGFVRFVSVILLTIALAYLILSYHQEILEFVWSRPESPWVLWLWHILSWFLSFILVGVGAILSYLASQVLFGVIIMDLMSRITEQKITGGVKESEKMPILRQFSHMIKQEIPRAIIPIVISLLLMILGWLTPLGPLFMLLSSCAAIIFLAWDNSDLVPARQAISFRERFRFLSKTISFHLGFGLPFLIPGLNILFLSFAPVGATLYHLERDPEVNAGLLDAGERDEV